MNPIPASLVIAVIVTIERWRKGEFITMQNVIGVAVLALMLAIIAQANRDLAKAFGLLAVAGVLLAQTTERGTVPVFEQVGLGGS